MAYTATLKKHNVVGNQRMVQYSVAADAAAGIVATPLSVIDSAFISPISMTTNGIVVKINTTTASAVCNGVVFFSNVTSTDVFFLMVYGRS